ncbi:MAG: NAD-dependent succinate-semialdehyde dehydrogenase [Propionibacterium sp.]|nr:MAG: NAD-dependent succinate-semialdehyde dehydrogenase [Propionibacterium sp.]
MSEIVSSVPSGQFIGGEWIEAPDSFPVFDPATGDEIARVADGGPETALAALTAAHEAQAEWAATDPRRRTELLRTAFEIIIERKEEFARLITLEMGKPLAEARGEVDYGAEFLRWFADIGAQTSGRFTRSPSGQLRILTTKQPVGPVLAITPWNFPLAMGTRKIAPALAAGCTVVLKPASATPLTSLLFLEVLREAGLPAGVVNCFTTSRSGDATRSLLSDPRLRKLTFTGSTEVGVALAKAAAGRMLRTSLELGGNAPVIVCADADLDVAVPGAAAAKLRNVGEACTAANRFLVHESLAEEFTDRLVTHFESLKLGAGLDADTDIGPLIDRAALDNCERLVADAESRGARVRCGGSSVGNCWQPTLVTDVPDAAAMWQEEIFAPIAPVQTFSDIDDAVHRANSTDAGLISYLFTRDVASGLRISEALESGLVGLNAGVISNPAAPFGGVKMSGLGREGSFEGIEEYLSTKYIGMPM